MTASMGRLTSSGPHSDQMVAVVIAELISAGNSRNEGGHDR
jgi:hypothetical protein